MIAGSWRQHDARGCAFVLASTGRSAGRPDPTLVNQSDSARCAGAYPALFVGSRASIPNDYESLTTQPHQPRDRDVPQRAAQDCTAGLRCRRIAVRQRPRHRRLARMRSPPFPLAPWSTDTGTAPRSCSIMCAMISQQCFRASDLAFPSAKAKEAPREHTFRAVQP
jgi:hypothetical protein